MSEANEFGTVKVSLEKLFKQNERRPNKAQGGSDAPSACRFDANDCLTRRWGTPPRRT
jgi:hypothetical protein